MVGYDNINHMSHLDIDNETPPTVDQNRFLDFWVKKLPSEDILLIELDIFNTSGDMTLDTILESDIPPEKARSIMAAFKAYILSKRGGHVTKEALKEEARRIYEYTEKAALKG